MTAILSTIFDKIFAYFDNIVRHGFKDDYTYHHVGFNMSTLSGHVLWPDFFVFFELEKTQQTTFFVADTKRKGQREQILNSCSLLHAGRR